MDALIALKRLMDSDEDQHLEFKLADRRYDFEELVKYCCALANECGGKMVLGVTDRRPRRVIGTGAFERPEQTVAGLIERLHLRIDVETIIHPEGRVLVFHVPSRPVGYPIQYRGAYWMRRGEELAPMTQDMLRRIFEETAPDFSAELCLGVTLEDLDGGAIEAFRDRWLRKSHNTVLQRASPLQLLNDAELMVGDRVT